jgi:serine/threonine protein kinase
MNENAAHNLEGRLLKTGWLVVEKLEKPPGSTGAFFSVGYKVERDGEVCFLKAFDFNKFSILSEAESPGRKFVDIWNEMTNVFIYERDLSNHCRDQRVTKVSFVREADEEVIDGYTYPVVPYLIFDLADGDVRSQIAYANKLDFTWKLKSLHDIAVGLKQLHQIEVSHQDVKPSNVLLFGTQSKIGDLGRSLCKTLQSPYEGRIFTGDLNYVPPEIMYGYYDNDWHRRVYATDSYLLGSMVVFYFSGITMSALLVKNLQPNFRVENWRGELDQIKPYLVDAFARALKEFASCFTEAYYRDELVKVVEQLCYPLPDKRGHKKTIQQVGSNFNLERFVSIFDRLHHRAEYELKR